MHLTPGLVLVGVMYPSIITQPQQCFRYISKSQSATSLGLGQT